MEPSITTLQITFDPESIPQQIHFLPCKIEYEGSAPVDRYFLVDPLTSRDAEADPNVLVSTFRGRGFLGATEKIPEGAKGLIVSENFEFPDYEEKEDEEDDEARNGQRILQIEGMFESLTYWNHDVIPKNDQHVARWMDSIRLARIVHDTEQ